MMQNDKSQSISEEQLRQQIALLNLRINDMMVQLNTVLKMLTEENAGLKKEVQVLKTSKEQ
jgi:hypothetical protein